MDADTHREVVEDFFHRDPGGVWWGEPRLELLYGHEGHFEAALNRAGLAAPIDDAADDAEDLPF